MMVRIIILTTRCRNSRGFETAYYSIPPDSFSFYVCSPEAQRMPTWLSEPTRSCLDQLWALDRKLKQPRSGTTRLPNTFWETPKAISQMRMVRQVALGLGSDLRSSALTLFFAEFAGLGVTLSHRIVKPQGMGGTSPGPGSKSRASRAPKPKPHIYSK